LGAGNVSNDAFWWLFPTYTTSEDIFVVPGSKYTPGNPDNLLDDPASGARTNTLKIGECSYAYITGLTDTSNAAFPLVADGWTTPVTTPPAYDVSKSNKGGVWAAKKAVVLFVDASAQIMKCSPATATPALTVVRSGHLYSLFDNASSTTIDPWLEAANLQLDPQ
jgi:hypothetical protein